MATTGKLTRETFLRGSDVENKVKELISQATKVRVAVAYWGKGSFARLDAETLAYKDLVIVCDLMSGACNPSEIELLQEHFGSDVLTRDHLHAKVWLTDRGAIVGSSNMSANGLGFEGDELTDSVEANVFIDNPETLAAIDHWFEADVMKSAREIKEPDIREAKRRWKRRRATRPPPSPEGSLLDTLKSNPASLSDRGIVVWATKYESLDSWAARTLKSEQKKRHSLSIDCWQDVKRRPPGSYVIDFDIDENGDATLDGLYQIPWDDPLVKTKSGTLLLRKPVKAVEGLQLGDKKAWEDAVTEAHRTRREAWPVTDFSKKFLSNRV